MPEGPSIVIIKEELQAFKGKKILRAEGNAKIDIARLNNLKIVDLKSWGKHFLICFKDFYLRIHLLMFGTYRINERKDAVPRLQLQFKDGEFSFYTCSIRMIEGSPDETYEWEADVMNEEWNATKATKKIKALKTACVSDVLLNQQIFSGVGNIIKNEVLYRIKVHPESDMTSLPAKKLKELVKEAVKYSHEFYHWKKAFVLKKQWLIYKKKICPRCDIPIQHKYVGKGKRLTFFCENCQVLYK